jgi:hypothetical protein
LSKFGKNFLQVITMKIKMKTYELAVAAVHCPPRHNIKEENFFDSSEHYKFIAGGDYNCKNSLWGSRLTTTKGRN